MNNINTDTANGKKLVRTVVIGETEIVIHSTFDGDYKLIDLLSKAAQDKFNYNKIKTY